MTIVILSITTTIVSRKMSHNKGDKPMLYKTKYLRCFTMMILVEKTITTQSAMLVLPIVLTSVIEPTAVILLARIMRSTTMKMVTTIAVLQKSPSTKTQFTKIL